jgi:hypothetical protein
VTTDDPMALVGADTTHPTASRAVSWRRRRLRSHLSSGDIRVPGSCAGAAPPPTAGPRRSAADDRSGWRMLISVWATRWRSIVRPTPANDGPCSQSCPERRSSRRHHREQIASIRRDSWGHSEEPQRGRDLGIVLDPAGDCRLRARQPQGPTPLVIPTGGITDAPVAPSDSPGAKPPPYGSLDRASVVQAFLRLDRSRRLSLVCCRTVNG